MVFTFSNLNKKIPLQIWNDPMSFEMTPWAKWPHETSQFEMTPWAQNTNDPMAHGGEDTGEELCFPEEFRLYRLIMIDSAGP